MSYLDEVINLYSKQEISLGSAAKLVKLSISDFLEELSKRKVSIFQYSAEEVLEEAKIYDV